MPGRETSTPGGYRAYPRSLQECPRSPRCLAFSVFQPSSPCRSPFILIAFLMYVLLYNHCSGHRWVQPTDIVECACIVKGERKCLILLEIFAFKAAVVRF